MNAIKQFLEAVSTSADAMKRLPVYHGSCVIFKQCIFWNFKEIIYIEVNTVSEFSNIILFTLLNWAYVFKLVSES